MVSNCFLQVSRCLLLLALAWLIILPAPAAADRFENVERVVAFADVHGAYDQLTDLLQQVGVIDQELAWSGGRTHLVSLGDLLHRGDQGRQVMDLLMRLQDEAQATGGAVHVVLGNHEALALTGDFRYVSPGDFAQFGSEPAGEYPPGFVERRRAFAPDGTYGRWLLELPAMIVVNDTLFLHGGISRLLNGLSLEEINHSVRRDLRRFAEGWHVLLESGHLAEGDDFDVIRARAAELAEDSEQEPEIQTASRHLTEALGGLPFHPDGPLWYRGTARCHPYVESPVSAAILEQLGAARVVMGHTPTLDRRISSRLGKRAYAIDTGMNPEAYRGRPAALVIEGETSQAFYAGEGPAPVAAEPNRVWVRPYGKDDAALEEFLRTAEVTQTEDIGIGVTGSKRLTLEKDGRRVRALFKTIDTDPGLERGGGRWPRDADFADRYIYEIAAYHLDRLLGLEMVPVTVLRTIDKTEGAVQYWIENSFSENQRRERNIPFTGDCRLQPQYDLMNVFDILTFNVDRNLGDILYDPDWTLWLIDHSRSFGTQRGVPDMIRRSNITLYPEMRSALEKVTPENLDALEPYLHRRQLQALVNRAQAIRKRF